MALSENAIKVLEKRYLSRNAENQLIETPEGMFRRVAHAVAAADAGKVSPARLKEIEEEFYNLMMDLEFLPNSPTLMNAGRPLGQLSACFVLPVGDSMEEIFDSVKNAALIHKSGGGTGFSFSRLRQKGATVNSTGGVASGPVSFMKVFNAATEAVKQGGTRRGANMGILRVDHPDILEFIACKQDNADITNFNISVGLTEAFMNAVEAGADYDLIDPKTQKAVGTLNAHTVFEFMVKSAWRNGEPGMIFLDRLNRSNVTPALGDIESTNPCISGDTWVLTDAGPRQVKNIVGQPVELVLNGGFSKTAPEGFFRTGTKDVLKLVTDRGYSLTLTENHLVRTVSDMTHFNREEKWTPAGELQPGDRILLSNNRQAVWSGKGTGEAGFLLGALIGDGSFRITAGQINGWGEAESDVALMRASGAPDVVMHHRPNFQARQSGLGGSGEYRVAQSALMELSDDFGCLPVCGTAVAELEQTGSDFHAGFLRGLFETDGTIVGSLEQGVSVRLWHRDMPLLLSAQRMLHRMGIASVLYPDRKPATGVLAPEGLHGLSDSESDIGHELAVCGENMAVFAERIGFESAGKRKQAETMLSFYKRSLNRERYTASILEIVPAGREDVYDVQVPGVNAFDANGVVVHNCGEQPLLPYEACNLGSINLSLLVKRTAKKTGVDYPRLTRIVRKAVHFLDNVIDVNRYPLPDIDRMTRGTRKIGLGVMGWADMLLQLGIPYDSEEAEALGRKVMSHIQNESHAASIKLAEEKGVFPYWEDSIYKEQGIRLRNATTTTIAPTGTLSMLAGVSSGVEPMFAIAYIKNVMDRTELFETNPYFRKAAEAGGFYSVELMKRVVEHGTLHGMDDVPEDVRRLYVTAHDISPEWHVRMQAAFQDYTDNAVSKTVNLANEATEEDVREVFLQAYHTGCKGVTIYRDGSRGLQVLNIGKVKEEKKADAVGTIQSGKTSETVNHVTTNPAVASVSGRAASAQVESTDEHASYLDVPDYGHIAPRPRPEITTGFTEKVKIGCGNLYITVNYDENGICEVFTNTGRTGGCPSQSEATSRLVSIALRAGIDEKAIVEQLKGIRCPSTIRQKGLKVLSCPDAIGRLIEKVSNHRNGNGSVHVPSAESAARRIPRPVGNTAAVQNVTAPVILPQAIPAQIGRPAMTQGAQTLAHTAKNIPSRVIAASRSIVMNEDGEYDSGGHDCPECGEVMEHEGGCKICRSCGYSKCG